MPNPIKNSFLTKLEAFHPSDGLAYLFIWIATFLWALSTVVVRGHHEEIPPFGLSFWRWLLAILIFLPLVWRELFLKTAIIKAHFKLIWVLGILQVGSSALFLFSLSFTTAINASLINAAQPVLTVIPAWLLTREKINFAQGVGILLALAGVTIMITRGDLQVLTTLGFNIGDLFVVLAILGWSFYATILHRLPKELGLTTSLFLIYLMGTISLLPFYVIESVYFRTFTPTGLSISVMTFLGIAVSAGAVSLWTASVRSIGPNRAAIFTNLIPVFAVVLAIIFLGERLFPFHLSGAAFVVVGMMLVIKMARKKTAVPQAPGTE
ncbi:MAG: DMT family transporter [Proteobacteria bacterium]|nr:DMT family transporter [Pseudomonadota bacterium]